MTFEQAFLKIKEKFDNADASKTSDFAIQITFTDEDCGGTFYAEVKNGKLAVEPYDYYDNDVVLNISKSALLAVLSGRSSLDKAIANGEAYVQGDASKIADWKGTITKAAKKVSAKKTAAKKSPAKKTAAKKAPAKAAAKTTVEKTPAKKTAKSSAKKENTEKKVNEKATAKTAAPASVKTTTTVADKKTTTAKTTK